MLVRIRPRCIILQEQPLSIPRVRLLAPGLGGWEHAGGKPDCDTAETQSTAKQMLHPRSNRDPAVMHDRWDQPFLHGVRARFEERNAHR